MTGSDLIQETEDYYDDGQWWQPFMGGDNHAAFL